MVRKCCCVLHASQAAHMLHSNLCYPAVAGSPSPSQAYLTAISRVAIAVLITS
jgi:hypothetical protein